MCLGNPAATCMGTCCHLFFWAIQPLCLARTFHENRAARPIPVTFISFSVFMGAHPSFADSSRTCLDCPSTGIVLGRPTIIVSAERCAGDNSIRRCRSLFANSFGVGGNSYRMRCLCALSMSSCASISRHSCSVDAVERIRVQACLFLPLIFLVLTRR